jgi:hypothetical protein
MTMRFPGTVVSLKTTLLPPPKNKFQCWNMHLSIWSSATFSFSRISLEGAHFESLQDIQVKVTTLLKGLSGKTHLQ